LIISSATFEVGDDAVAQRADGLNVAGRAAQHHLRFVADGQNLLLALDLGDRHHRRLVQDDARALDVDQGIGGAQIDRHVGGQEPEVRIACGACCLSKYQERAAREPAIKPCTKHRDAARMLGVSRRDGRGPRKGVSYADSPVPAILFSPEIQAKVRHSS
jgi:hypothetical protein